MEQKTPPKPRMVPLPVNYSAGIEETLLQAKNILGYVPNSFLIMQRKPEILKSVMQLMQAVWAPGGEVEPGLKRLIAHVASRAAGCQYCMAHTAGGALHHGVEDRKLAAVWEYRTNALFSEGERAALDFALAAGSVPNEVTDEMFDDMRRHWNEGQIVEILAVIAMFGFFNRWNDTMATPLEDEPVAVAQQFLAPHGWIQGRHARSIKG